MSSSRDRTGFTVIEMIVVLVIIAALAGLVGPSVFRNVSDSRVQSARAQIELFGMALEAYRLDNGQFPTTDQGLASLWVQPTQSAGLRWRGPYTRKEIPVDPWGRAYVFKYPSDRGEHSYDLMSYGRDGQPGGTGEDADLTSWESVR